MQPITPCLWFDDQAEEAAKFYTDIFPNSRIGNISRYGEAGKEFHGKPAGTVLVVEFELNGQPYTALNGGPQFTFNEAISLQVHCETQTEVDDYWEKLAQGGDETAQRCGWLKDKFGLSWQIIPSELIKLMQSPERGKVERMMNAMFRMKKLRVAELKREFGA